SPDGFDGGSTADWGLSIGSDDDAPYNIEDSTYAYNNPGPPVDKRELFVHNQYYEFIGVSTIYNDVNLYKTLGIDEIKGSAIYDIDFNNSWTNFKNAGYVKRILYKDDTTHNLPDVYLEGIYGDPGEIIQISPDEFIVNKEVGGEWIDEVKIDDETIPWDIKNAYEYDPTYGLGKVQYYYHQDGVANDNLIATVYGPDFSLYDWNISMLDPGEYEVYALGIDNVNNTQTQIHSLYLEIVETAFTWISDLAGFPVEDIYYNENTLHGCIPITAQAQGEISGFKFYSSPDGVNWELLPDGIMYLPVPSETAIYDVNGGWDVTELPDDEYYIGVTSLEDIEDPLFATVVTIDNTLVPDGLELLVTQTIHNDEILGKITEIVLEHDPNITDLADAVTIDYSNMAPDSPWTDIGTPSWDCLTNTVTVLLDNVPTWDTGFYQFRIIARDLAIPDANVDTLIFAQDIRFDSAAPEITDFALIQNGFEHHSLEPDDSVRVSAGDPVSFKLFADDKKNDVCGSGITHATISLAYDGNWGEQIIILDETYDSVPTIEELVDFDLSDYPLGEYSIKIVLEDIVNILHPLPVYYFTLLSPDMIPEPIIAGFDFKENPNCKDRIYAFTKACYLPNGSQIPATGIRFEYTIDGGTNWIDIGTTITEVDASASGNEKLYRVNYNVAEIELIRPVAYLEIADSIYSKIGVPVDPADYTAFSQMTADGLRIVANHVAKVGSATPVEFIIALSEISGDDNCDNDEAEIVELSSNNNAYAGDIVIANPESVGANSGTVTLWMYNAFGLSYSTMNVHKVTPNFGSNGIVTSYDEQMTADVPAHFVQMHNDNAVWFEPNEEYYPTNNEMLTQVSVTEKVNYYGALPGIPAQLPVYTLAYDPVFVPAEAFLEVYCYFSGMADPWVKIEGAVFNDTEAEFTTICTGEFAVFANSSGILNLAIGDEIVLEPNYNNAYTNDSPDFETEVVYEGDWGNLKVDAILDGFYIIENSVPMSCGNVVPDTCGIPGVNWIYTIETDGLDLDTEISHTIQILLRDDYGNEDETNVLTFNVDLVAPVVSNATYEGLTFSAEITDALTEVADVTLAIEGTTLSVELYQMTIAGDTYSYTFGYAELAGALCEPFGTLTAEWMAFDALFNYDSYEFSYDYDLSYSITFEAFNGSFWYNPTMTNEFFFNVNIPEGVVIANGGVIVDFEIDGSTVQENTMATDLGGNRYKVNYGGNYPPSATAITLIAEVTTTDGSPFDAQQNYGIDYGAPSVWAISPIGDPIDNDNDGLYNEDWPDLVNQDQDYDDLNHNGVWDWDDINGNGIWDLYLYSYVTPCDTLCYWVEEPGEPGIVDEDPVDFSSPEMPYGTEVVISIGYEDIPQYVVRPDCPEHGYNYTAASGIDEANIQLLLNGNAIDNENITISAGVLAYNAGVLEAGHYVITSIIPDLAGNVGTTWVGQNANPWQFEFDIKAPAPTVDFQPLLVGGTETWIVQPYDDMQNLFRFSVNWGGNAEIVPNEVNITFIEQSTEAILDGPRTILADSTNGTMAFYSEYLGSNVIDELTPGIIFEVEATNIWDACSVSRHTYMIMHSPELSFALPNEMVYSENPLRLDNGSKGITSFPLNLTRDAYVTIEIYDFAGKKVKVLKTNELIKRLTSNYVTWDGTNDKGQNVARGGYVTRIIATGASGDVQDKKIVEMLKIGVVK
ncbi:MAG: hypothetical protein P9L95_01460, partial [Candidatus Tenebribacter mawsonii]|nr:hypothetical protein [Candidatus Tenebribacter mawsonii]